MPLLRGDTVAAGVDSQAEIQIDPSNLIRLAPGSEIQIADLTSTQIRLRVARGLVTYTVLESNERQIELHTPNMTVHPVVEGVYHVQVLSPTETLLIVRKGDADVSTPEGTTSVDEGKIINVRGSDNPEYLITAAFDPDDWGKWNSRRDKVARNTGKTQHASREHNYELYSNKTSYLATAPAYGNWCLTPLVNAGWISYLPDDPSKSSSQIWAEGSIQITISTKSTW